MHPIVLAIALAIVFGSVSSSAQSIVYPKTQIVPVVDTIHGAVVRDPYRWLENDRAPEVEHWVDQQDSIARSYLRAISYRNGISSRLRQLYAYTKKWGFDRVGTVSYFRRQSSDENHGLLVRQLADQSEDTILDPNQWSADGTTSLGMWSINDDGTYLAYARSEAGSDWQTIYVMDLRTKQHLADTLRWVKVSGLSWYRDGFFYSRYPAPSAGSSELSSANFGHMAMYHRVTTPQDADEIIWSDPTKPEEFHFVWVPEGSSFMLRSSRAGGSRGTSIYYRPANDRAAPWKVLYESDTVELGIVDITGNTLLATTTANAPNRKLIRVDDFTTEWVERTVLPHSEWPLEVSKVDTFLIATVMKHVVDSSYVCTLDGRYLHTVQFGALGSIGGYGARQGQRTALVTFSSYTSPTTTFEYDPQTNTLQLWSVPFLPFDASKLESRQVFVRSNDGTRVPMTLITMKGKTKPKASPTMLYGYGGFGISQTPGFNPLIVPWLEAGGTWAIANLRGGGEYGETWHEAGTKTNKQNVFDDAIACAQWLVDSGITSPSKLAVNGRSNGGLLVGALLTQRPDLFRVAIPEVGVLDMLRYHTFTIGWNWARDYGTVADSAEFRALYAYSPYHNVRSGVRYPSVMVMTADHDDRVVPAHSFKFAAALQALAGPQSSPILMRVERRSGHGAVNTSILLDGMADKLAFALWEMGIR
jgi:prolyl oligopeptidase